jgi:hypothetical protein
MTSWARHARIFGLLAEKLRADWNCRLPPHDTLPSEELNKAVSAWCYMLAKNLMAPLNPPAVVQPWILARILSMRATALALAKLCDTDCPKLDEKTLRQFLISEWHGAGRGRWIQKPKLGGE